jgi:hypothetical protein
VRSWKFQPTALRASSLIFEVIRCSALAGAEHQAVRALERCAVWLSLVGCLSVTNQVLRR